MRTKEIRRCGECYEYCYYDIGKLSIVGCRRYNVYVGSNQTCDEIRLLINHKTNRT